MMISADALPFEKVEDADMSSAIEDALEVPGSICQAKKKRKQKYRLMFA